jgi:acyl-CoA hydrolase
MPGEGDLPASAFSHILDDPATDFQLFAPPKSPIGTTDYAIGIHVARLIADGGTLQIGIGEEGDAAVAAMIMRHRHNAEFRRVVSTLTRDAPPLAIEETGTFDEGLYGVSEMLVDGFLELVDAGILKRAVDGVILHGGFFIGPHSFYRRLREMPPEVLARIHMTRISFTNQLYGDEQAKKAARVKARFVNSAMMATALGAVISDALEDGRVVSGVGGQFNFVDQAFALPGAHSIIGLNATRNGKSNILWSYGHTTIPRHLRDIIVTEYGIADLRGQPDEEVVHRMIAITDSRFQEDLVRRAKDVGKLAKSYEVPAMQRENHPERIAAALKPLRDNGMLPDFPFGSDFTDVELRLIPALERLQAAKPMDLARLALAGMGNSNDIEALGRMGYAKPASLGDRFWRALLNGALKT